MVLLSAPFTVVSLSVDVFVSLVTYALFISCLKENVDEDDDADDVDDVDDVAVVVMSDAVVDVVDDGVVVVFDAVVDVIEDDGGGGKVEY